MKGLNTDIPLQNGKFLLSEGKDKVADALSFFCNFEKNRIYLPKYGADFVSLLQKPTSTLLLNKVLIEGTLETGIYKYVSDIKQVKCTLGFNKHDRKTSLIQILYSVNSHNLDANSQIYDVIFK